jgi:hypothetical protein
MFGAGPAALSAALARRIRASRSGTSPAVLPDDLLDLQQDPDVHNIQYARNPVPEPPRGIH